MASRLNRQCPYCTIKLLLNALLLRCRRHIASHRRPLRRARKKKSGSLLPPTSGEGCLWAWRGSPVCSPITTLQLPAANGRARSPGDALVTPLRGLDVLEVPWGSTVMVEMVFGYVDWQSGLSYPSIPHHRPHISFFFFCITQPEFADVILFSAR